MKFKIIFHIPSHAFRSSLPLRQVASGQMKIDKWKMAGKLLTMEYADELKQIISAGRRFGNDASNSGEVDCGPEPIHHKPSH
jgi:hypothetical protein